MRVALPVWERFGDVANYVEPFAGSLAVLLGRPTAPRIETVNDKDCFIANFWRALKAEPQALAELVQWPINEADLHARHAWLVGHKPEQVSTDPDYYDLKTAAWWVWGICQWIGGGWGEKASLRLPALVPPRGVFRRTVDTLKWLQALSHRLASVRICCGDWSRVVCPVSLHGSRTAIFLDPPYSAKANRCVGTYACDDLNVALAVREWALDHGDDPRLRIALCGYEGEHEMPSTWECFAWDTGRAFNQGQNRNDNRKRERVWFSPNCLKPNAL